MIPAGTAILNKDTDEVICYTLVDIFPGDTVMASLFGNFTKGNDPWKPHDLVDKRCTRDKPGWFGGLQIYTENGWGP